MNKKIEMFQTLMKSTAGGYRAVLSDNSIDRDGEIVGPKALDKVANLQLGKVPILLNHDNVIENLIGEWVNRRMENIDGHTAFIAEPKFYMSNPKAQFIKGLLDDGAECGISIGAIVKDTEVQKINNQDVTVYTDIELLEASFVAIPSNRHGAAMAVAKSFNKKMEASKMDEELTKEFESKIEALEKSLAEKDSQIESLTKEAEAEEVPAEVVEEEVVEEVVEEVKEETKAFESEIAALKEEVAELKKAPVNKGNLETVEEITEEAKKAAEVEEAMTKGFLPVMRGN